MNINEFARKKEVQVLCLFGLIVLGGYYIMLKKQKKAEQWVKP